MALSLRTRFTVLERDQFTCRYCGKHPPFVVLEVDHVQPLARGGAHSLDNLVTACWDCNRGKKHHPLRPILDPDEEWYSGFRYGRGHENDRLKDLFLNRLEYGIDSFADVVAALWPEPD